MSKKQNKNGSFDNAGYWKDDEGNNTLPIEPAPRQFLPRVITGSEFGGQKPPAYDDYQSEITPKNEKAITESGPPASDPEAEDPDGDRQTWDNPIEFLMSCISMSVGLGNVWRFPGTAAANGGGAFLIPYLVVLLVIGRPLYYLEMCLGQFSKFGQVKVWNLAPISKGVGYGSMMGVIAICSYYCSLMALTVYYFIKSFSKTLPWAECHPDDLPGNLTCESIKGFEAQAYFDHTVFPQRPNVDSGLGQINWQLALCLAFSWLVIFLSLARGVKSSGKVAYFTAIFPYVVLLILLIRGVTLPGAWKGIKVFLKPEWKEILKPKVWYEAVAQCFFSLSTGFGPIIMFSSYNKFRQNVYRDALIISFMDTFTSLLAGVTVFAVIGNLMEENGLKEEEIQGGPGLTFVLYPQAIAKFDWVPQLFAVLFFLMLFTLGLGSATSLTGGVITIICDQFSTWKRWLVTAVVCTCGCLLGLMYVTEGGSMMLELIDNYGASLVIYVMAIVETASISYIYGLSNICHDFEFMLGRSIGIYWKVCWAIVLPLGLLANLIYYFATQDEFKASNGQTYPTSAMVCAWLLTAFAVSLVPIWGLHAILTRKAPTFMEKFKLALKPTPRWGPQNAALRREWLAFREEKDGRRRRFILF